MFSTLSSIFILVFSTPTESVMVGAYDTHEDCEEVAWSIGLYLSGSASFQCVKEEEA